MAVKLGQGFQVTSTNPIDTRLVLSKAQMLAVDDRIMPSKYFALCTDDNQIYIYNKAATANTTTGKFTAQSADAEVVIRGYYLNDKFWTDSTYTTEVTKKESCLYLDKNNNDAMYSYTNGAYSPVVGDASALIKGVMKLYTGSGSNEDGTMTQKAITEGINSISFKLDTTDEECLVLDLPWD